LRFALLGPTVLKGQYRQNLLHARVEHLEIVQGLAHQLALENAQVDVSVTVDLQMPALAVALQDMYVRLEQVTIQN
jgi:hypothetical protein